MDQAKVQSGWTTYAAMEQKRASLTVATPAGNEKTVDITKTCQSHVAKHSVPLLYSFTV